MAPGKFEPAVKRGRGRPPKHATKAFQAMSWTSANVPGLPASSTAKQSTNARSTPSKRGPGRPRKEATLPNAATTKVLGSGAAAAAKTAPASGIQKKRGRPAGSSTNSALAARKTAAASTPKKTTTRPASTTISPGKATAKAKASPGRPRGKHVSNLNEPLRRLISGASRESLADLLTLLCDRNAVVARTAANALRLEELQLAAAARQRREDGFFGPEEGYARHEEEDEDGGGAVVSGKALEGSRGTNGTVKEKNKGKGKGKGKKAQVDQGRATAVEKHGDQQMHTEQATEPKSGYEADVEPEIPATATEAGDAPAMSQEDAVAETELITQAVSSMRDHAFAL